MYIEIYTHTWCINGLLDVDGDVGVEDVPFLGAVRGHGRPLLHLEQLHPDKPRHHRRRWRTRGHSGALSLELSRGYDQVAVVLPIECSPCDPPVKESKF
jgi:hypothetical protein